MQGTIDECRNCGNTDFRQGSFGFCGRLLAAPARSLSLSLCCSFSPADRLADEIQGDLLCTMCGMVIEKVIHEGAEWRVFADADEDRSRVGTTLDFLEVRNVARTLHTR